MATVDNIIDTGLKSRTSAAIADSSVTYQEMLDIFSTAKTGGMTSAKFSDLKTIYSISQPYFASDYLGAITKNIIYGNTANAKWWGGTANYNSVSTLGNLADSTSQGNVEKLINKWFMGTDLPMPLADGDAATGNTGAASYSYSTATGSLFVGGAAASDVNQGYLGDCYYVAVLGAIANTQSAYLTNMFTDNQNGTYGVQYYINGSAVYTTVNKSLPVDSGKLIFAGNTTKSTSGELWVALAEKSYAQLNSQADLGNSGLENNYGSIGQGGLASPIKQITNLNYKYYSSYYNDFGDPFDSGCYTASNSSTYKQTIINALNNGAIGWLGSFGSTYGSNGKQNLVSGHAFMLLGYNSSTDKFILRNPWGGDGTDDYNVQFEVPISDFWNSSAKGVVALSDASTQDTDYSYSLSTDSGGSSSSAVSEGATVKVTVTRSSSGTASTAYITTEEKTAGSSDFSSLNKYTLSFGENQTVKTFTIATLTDSQTEGTEYFNVQLLKSSTATTAHATSPIYVKDAASSDYTYSLTSNALTTGSAVIEGNNATFTVTRDKSGSVSTVYVSTQAGTAGSSDYSGVTKQAVTFAANELIKTVPITTLTDSLKEGTEGFSLLLYKNYADDTHTASSQAYIKDPGGSSSTYKVTSSSSQTTTAVSEGGQITLTITRPKSSSAGTVYISTIDGTANSSDYVGFTKKEIYFAPNQTVSQVTIDINKDWWLEGTEYFNTLLYKKYADTTSTASVKSYIKNTAVDSYNYSIASSADSSAAVVEGSDITFTVTRSDSGTASTVYVSTTSGSAGSSDYSALDKQAVTFGANETTKTITVSTLTDSLTEDNEYFNLDLYRNYIDSSATAYASAYIKDATVVDYSYTLSTSANSTPADEGSDISFTITRSSSGAASTVYVSTAPGTADASDYTAFDKQAVSFAAYETTKTITVSTLTDALTEGSEYLWLNLYKNAADSDYDHSSYTYAYIQDTTAANYTYKVSSTASSTSKAIAEGSDISFTITRSSSGSASTIYVSTTPGSAGASDYTAFDKQAVSFGANETTKTVTVSTLTDSVTEGNEYFWLDLYKNAADSTYSTYASAYIKDAVATNYSYTLSTSAGSTPVAEGSDISFTITRSSTGSASTVYVSTAPGSAGTSDYTAFDKQAVTFGANETTKTVTVSTLTDSLATEGNEYFWLNLYKNAADSDYSYSSYAYAYIKDTVVADYSYTVSTSASSTPVAEGSDITFTVTRSGSGAASTVYVSTSAGSAGTSDFTALEKQAVSFAAYETSKSVTVSTLTDSVTEGNEYFWLDLYKNAADSTYSTYASAYIQDTVTADYSYTVSSSASSSAPVAEGSNVTFTITRSSSGATSTVYVSTSAGTAGTSDYTTISTQAISFGANETTKTVTVSTLTDSVTEGNEYFWLDLYKNAADSTYSTYASAYIKDAVATNYSYTLSTSAGSTPVAEGSDITFTVTRSGSGAASTVYVSTAPGTAGTSDYTSFSKQAVSFGANETTKTVTVSTLTDSLATEGSEYFWLNLYKNAADSDYSYSSYAYAYIKDTVVADYSYTVSTSASSTPVAEGSDITFTVTRSGSGAASTVYVSTSAGSAGTSDFTALEKQAVSFAAYETSKTVTVSTLTDSVTEGNEYFWLDLYKNAADSTYSTYSSAYIKDTVVVDYSYTVSTSASGTAVSEGSDITFTIERSSSGTASTVYVSTAPGSAGTSDYTAFDKQVVSFGASETTKTVTVSTLTDSLTEGNEYFWLNLFKNAADSDYSYSSYAYAYIKDTVATNYSYTIASSASSSAPVAEGSDITFTITRSGSGADSTVYVSTAAGTASASDYTAFDKQAISFAASETTKTVTVSTLTDSLTTEGNEYFWLNLYKNAADTTYSTYSSAYIKDVVTTSNYDYTVTSNYSSSGVTEGGNVTFTVTRSGSGDTSTIYVSTTPGTAGSSDYTALDTQAVSFGASETTKTVTVSTLTDSVTEGSEYFWLDLFKNAADTTYTSYGYAYIADGASVSGYQSALTVGSAAVDAPTASMIELSGIPPGTHY